LKKLQLLIAEFTFRLSFMRVCAGVCAETIMVLKSGYKKQKPPVLPEGF
jgi:hypothetical protein